MKQQKERTVLKNLALDISLTVLALMVFALFHHVLPRAGQSQGIVIENPYATGTSLSAQAEEKSNAAEASDSTVTAKTIQQTPSSSRTTTLFSGAQTQSSSSSRKGGKSSGKNSGRSGGQSSKGGSGLEEGETAGTTTQSSAPISEKFAEKYSDTPVITSDSYVTNGVSVSVSEHQTQDGSVTYYVADIYLKDVTSLRSALAQDTYGSGYRDSIENMALLNQALLAVNGDYYGNTTEGVVIRNGVIYRANATENDVCVLYYDGSMRVMKGSDFSVDEAIADGAWQAWTFGPALLDGEGKAIASYSSSGFIASANPRTAIGYYEPGHYCIVVVDGRGESAGMSLAQLSRLFEDMGCAAAYNLDGGKSSVMVWQGETYNQPSGGGRESSDAILITEANYGI
ncbi:MAG: phosphodiester glycosidase family protein [Clostridia bacterium]|nr:phosphodiester glycosidase family protein [Clostridia bacterium]